MTYKNDKIILQELGKKYREYANSPSNQEKIDIWTGINSLKPIRPAVIIDQICFNELEHLDQMKLECESPEFKKIETYLRRTIFRYEHARGDLVITPYLKIRKAVSDLRIGPKVSENIKTLTDNDCVVSHDYQDVINTYEDIENIEVPEVINDKNEDERKLNLYDDIFGNIIESKLKGISIHAGVWDRISMLRSVNNILMDIIDREDFIIALATKFADVSNKVLDELEKQNLLDNDLRFVHCTGSYNNELEKSENPTASNIWTFAMAQLFSTVSPSMHEAYEIDIFKSYYERFGLLYYGCCEPLDRKIDMIRKLNNVRKISVSPWADKQRSADNIASDYVFSSKPNPSFLAFDTFDEDLIRKDLTETVNICKKTNTPCELILKDISTIKSDPSRLSKWEKIAMEVVNSI